MASAHEEDVVIAFRQAVEEEMKKVQADGGRGPIWNESASSDEKLHQLAARYEELEHEVALLRTIVLRLVSDPVDRETV